MYKFKIKSFIQVDFYRFSISWSRVLPYGKSSVINHKGVEYYNNLIDELIKNKIQPMVTMWHFDLPECFENEGGFISDGLVSSFYDYAKFLFETFGDRVKHWITFNQPLDVALEYGKKRFGPKADDTTSCIGKDYVAARNFLQAHEAVYRLYHEEFNLNKDGRVGITLNSMFYYPRDGKDNELTNRGLQFNFGWFAHPLVFGTYPKEMIERVDETRLCKFSSGINIKGAFDFIGLNYYTSRIVENVTEVEEKNKKFHVGDLGLKMTKDPKWIQGAAQWHYSAPHGLGDLLRWIKMNYNNPEIIITENGWSDSGEINDTGRVEYIRSHLEEILKAIHYSQCNVTGYTAWSIIDNWEWFSGFT